jgi:signal transduction histidine kinase
MRLQVPWPTSIRGRTLLILLTSVVFVHLGSLLAYRESVIDAAKGAYSAQIAGRLVTARHAVADRPPDERDRTAHRLSSGGLELRWDRHPASEGGPAHDARARRLTASVLAAVPGLRPEELHLEYANIQASGDPHAILGAIQLTDGSWLNFSLPVVYGTSPNLRGALVSASVMALGVIIVAILLVRTLTAPLRALASAADAIGKGPDVALPEKGSDEVRQVTRAFNAMQARIHRLISDRTQALAAVSHDLRTPITRLRLRAGFLSDPEAQAAIDADLDEMEAMVDATLAYLRGDTEPEEPKPTDLATMLMTLVDAATDAGRPATYEGPQHAFAPVRGLALKRAFANLIENSLTYGGSAPVRLEPTDMELRVTIDDDGPGIPEAELERVFEPFRRLDASRNRQTGGVGLGLAIVRQAVLREGGMVRLINRPEGGLRAEIVIPRRAEGIPTRQQVDTKDAPVPARPV